MDPSCVCVFGGIGCCSTIRVSGSSVLQLASSLFDAGAEEKLQGAMGHHVLSAQVLALLCVTQRPPISSTRDPGKP